MATAKSKKTNLALNELKERRKKEAAANDNVDPEDSILVNNADAATINEKKISSVQTRFKKAKTSSLQPHPQNRFSMERDAEYLALLHGIKEFGMSNPITCYEEDGKYIILSGHRRHAAAQELGLEIVPIRIVPKFNSGVDELSFLGIENLSNRKQNPIDIALFAKDLEIEIEKEYTSGRKRDLLAQHIPTVSSKTLYSYMVLLDLPPEIQDIIRADHMTVKSGNTLAKLLKVADDKDAIINKILAVDIKEDMTTDEIKKTYSAVINSFIKKETPKNTKKPYIKKDLDRVNKKLQTLLTSDKYELPTTEDSIEKTKKSIHECIEKLNTLLTKLN